MITLMSIKKFKKSIKRSKKLNLIDKVNMYWLFRSFLITFNLFLISFDQFQTFRFNPDPNKSNLSQRYRFWRQIQIKKSWLKDDLNQMKFRAYPIKSPKLRKNNIHFNFKVNCNVSKVTLGPSVIVTIRTAWKKICAWFMFRIVMITLAP